MKRLRTPASTPIGRVNTPRTDREDTVMKLFARTAIASALLATALSGTAAAYAVQDTAHAVWTTPAAVQCTDTVTPAGADLSTCTDDTVSSSVSYVAP